MKLRDNVSEKVKSSIFISGSARSGTTIIGKIIHSMSNVEYVFEPPTLVPLFAQINTLDQSSWKLLFESYLYEDFYVNALAGRNLNFNRNDDSCIYNVKTDKEIHSRLDAGIRKHDIKRIEEKGVIAFKLPNMVPFLTTFNELYPDIKKIILVRNPVDTINSLMKKDWYNEKVLKEENRTWPVVEYKGQNIPFWVSEKDYDHWLGLDELNRCAYCFISMSTFSKSENTLTINYDELINNPEKEVLKLSKYLRLEFGPLTKELVGSIKKSKIERDNSVLDNLLPEFQTQLKNFEDSIQH
ncbi:sulfotransferase [Fulvivirga sp.]|uniref:sulfotransferase n=1 Tax=Fulvivirga sp. TaxID=1931237 RepID=UPI0032EDEBAB